MIVNVVSLTQTKKKGLDLKKKLIEDVSINDFVFTTHILCPTCSQHVAKLQNTCAAFS